MADGPMMCVEICSTRGVSSLSDLRTLGTGALYIIARTGNWRGWSCSFSSSAYLAVRGLCSYLNDKKKSVEGVAVSRKRRDPTYQTRRNTDCAFLEITTCYGFSFHNLMQERMIDIKSIIYPDLPFIATRSNYNLTLPCKLYRPPSTVGRRSIYFRIARVDL